MPDILDINSGPPVTPPIHLGKSFGAGFAAAIEEGYYMSPLDSALRYGAMSMRAELTEGVTGVGYTEASGHRNRASYERAITSHYWIDRQSAEKMLGDNGLTANDVKLSPYGANQVALEYAMELAQGRNRRERLMSDLGAVPRFGGELVGSMVDPVNLLTNFIPVVGQSKYVRNLERLGTWGKRLAYRGVIGAAEGALGAVLTEPIVVAAVQGEGGDYTSSDMVNNIIFGGIMGAGMHGGLGALRDWRYGPPTSDLGAGRPQGSMAEKVTELPQDVKYDALYKAEADGVYGRAIDVEPITARYIYDTDVAAGITMRGRADAQIPGTGLSFLDIADQRQLRPSEMDPGQLRAVVNEIVSELPTSSIPNRLRNPDVWTDAELADVVNNVMAIQRAPRRMAEDALRSIYGKDAPVPLASSLRDAGFDDLLEAGTARAADALDHAKKAGYLGPEASEVDLRSAIAREVAGEPVYRVIDAEKVDKFNKFTKEVWRSFASADAVAFGPDYRLQSMRDLDDVSKIKDYNPEFIAHVDELANVERQDVDAVARERQAVDDIVREIDRIGDEDLNIALRAEFERIEADAANVDTAFNEAIDCVLTVGAS